MTNGRGVTLDLWQRQAVLTATSFLRERFQASADPQARAVHDALLEVVEPKRRALRLQREMSKAADGAALTMKTERRARSRDRRGIVSGDRRIADLGSPTGVERRRGDRRGRDRRSLR